MLSLMLTLSLTAFPATTSSDAPRSARLVELEVRQLERKVVSAERMLPVWVPLTAGLVGGGAVTGLAVFMLTSVSLNYGTALLALLFVIGGPAVAVAGVVTAIVFGVRNATARSSRLRGLRDDLAERQNELQRLRDTTPTPPPLTVLTF